MEKENDLFKYYYREINTPDEGKIEWCKRITTGYLDQHTTLQPGQIIYKSYKMLFNIILI